MIKTRDQWLEPYKAELSERDFLLVSKAYDVLSSNTLSYKNAPWGDMSVISPWLGGSAGIWNWDSAFHAMTVCRFDTELAENCISAFMQYQKEDGMLPDVIFADGRIEDNYSKPPVMAQAVLTVYEASGDKNFLAENYKRLIAYERFWVKDRSVCGLFHYGAQLEPEKDDYLHPRWESGWDNSPRWDKPITQMWAIDLNCFMVQYYRAMNKMAGYLDLDGREWAVKEKRLSALIEEKLFDNDRCVYVDRNFISGQYSAVVSPASFMPLYVGISSQEHADKMKKYAEDKTKFYPGMPTVTYDDPAFSTGYWRGQAWLNVAYFAMKGLKAYGYEALASEMKEFILDMVYDNLDGGIYENYDTVKRIGMYCPAFSWSSCFVIEFVLNF